MSRVSEVTKIAADDGKIRTHEVIAGGMIVGEEEVPLTAFGEVRLLPTE
jgi:hypothetical protein